MIQALPLVALGGACGASLRWMLLALWPAPWTVMAVNVAGSFAIGALAGWVAPRPLLLLFLLPGLLGGFTTFSTFSLDMMRLWEMGRPVAALLYAGGSVLLSLSACALGLWLGRAFA
jgi:CrcB protein